MIFICFCLEENKTKGENVFLAYLFIICNLSESKREKEKETYIEIERKKERKRERERQTKKRIGKQRKP